MISPLVDYIKWANDYGISLEAIECPACKKKFEPSVPLALPGYRGLSVPSHGCGENNPFRVVPIDEKLEIWETLRPKHIPTKGANHGDER